MTFPDRLNIFRRYVLWRHSRGYGVHSPWAYAIIDDVFRNDGVYYADAEVGERFGARRRLALTVFRILVHLRPAAVTVLGGDQWRWLAGRSGCEGQGGAVTVVDDPALFDGWHDAETLLFTCLDTPEGRGAWQRARDCAGVPVTAIDSHRDLGILSRRQGLPEQTIHLRALR